MTRKLYAIGVLAKKSVPEWTEYSSITTYMYSDKGKAHVKGVTFDDMRERYPDHNICDINMVEIPLAPSIRWEAQEVELFDENLEDKPATIWLGKHPFGMYTVEQIETWERELLWRVQDSTIRDTLPDLYNTAEEAIQAAEDDYQNRITKFEEG